MRQLDHEEQVASGYLLCELEDLALRHVVRVELDCQILQEQSNRFHTSAAIERAMKRGRMQAGQLRVR